ncbi:glutathione ABC transporter substrate-binding protein [Bacillus sp. FSL W7-1360]
MGTNKKWLYAFSALVFAVVLASCSGSSTDKNANSSEGGSLVIAMSSEIPGLDPHQINDIPSTQVQDQIYETLVTLNREMELEPVLAKSWEVNENKLTFQLREGVKFHDGEPFNAEAVKKNIERIMDEQISSLRAFLFEEIKEINVIDNYEIEFVTEEPFAPLIYSFAHSGGSMISPAMIDADYEAMKNGEQPFVTVNKNPVGTGYFKYESGVPGTSAIVLKRNEDYWGEKAKLDSVTFKTVSEGGTRIAEVFTGDSHVAEPVDISNVSQLEANSDADLLITDGISASNYGFHVEKEPFDNPDVRRAIAMAIDNEAILENIMDGYGQIASGPIPPGVFGYDESIEPIPYDPEAAKQLLADAGVENLSVKIMTNDNNETRLQMAEYMQSALGEIGVDVEVVSQEWATYLESTGNGEHEMFILGWTSLTGDADYAMAPLYHTDKAGAPGNRSFYSNKELDQILEEAARELDENKRLALYKKAQEIAIEELPLVYTTYSQYLNAVRKEVKDFYRSADGKILLHETYIEE